jgi:hypothetical protein
MGNYILVNGIHKKIKKVGLENSFQKESTIMRDNI